MEINWLTLPPTLVAAFLGVFFAVFLDKRNTRKKERKEAIRLVAGTGKRAVNVYRDVCKQLAEIAAGDTGSVEGRRAGMKTYPLPVTGLRFLAWNASYQKNSLGMENAAWLYEAAELRYEKMKKAIESNNPVEGKELTIILYALVLEALVKWCSIDCRWMKGEIKTDKAEEDLGRLINDFNEADKSIGENLTVTLTDFDTLKNNYPIPPK